MCFCVGSKKTISFSCEYQDFVLSLSMCIARFSIARIMPGYAKYIKSVYLTLFLDSLKPGKFQIIVKDEADGRRLM